MTQLLAQGVLSHALPPELAANYNRVGMQRERILECLRRAGPAGVLRHELEAWCNVPSVTSRIAELRKKGEPIYSLVDSVTGADGLVSACVRYVLSTEPPAQSGLFDEAEQP